MAITVFDSTLERVRRTVLATTGLPLDSAVSVDTPLLQTGLALDSITLLEVLLALEHEFAIELDARHLFQATALRTIGSLTEFIDSKLAR